MNKPTNKIVATGAIALLIVLCALAWYKTSNKSQTSSAHGEATEEKVAVAGDEKGPHGGRLYRDGDFSAEVKIFEEGVEPHLRVYGYFKDKPLKPNEINANIFIKRLDAEQTITFKPESDYLIGNEIVYEPHSFLMVINVDYQGKKHSWKWDTKEGRVTMLDSSIKSSGLELLKVEPMMFENALELKGELKFPDNFESFITPKASGTLVKTYSTIGDKVSQGDLLATVQSQDLIRLNAERSIAMDTLQFSRKKMEQERTLFQKRVSPEIDYINAQREFEDAQIRANELNSLIRSYGGSGNGTIEVRAAMSGTILQVLGAVGSNVTPASPLFKIANTSQLLAIVNVPADKLNEINPDNKVTVKPQTQTGTEEALGRIKYISDVIDPKTRTAQVFIEISNQFKWRSGQLITAQIFEKQTMKQMVVREDALQTFRDWDVVFIRVGNDFEARPLELGDKFNGYVEVKSGLKAGQVYAAGNSYLLKAELGKSGATHDH
ncbi:MULTISPECIES: efflux RND transporter periplasmic adaptor subunit [Acinetobacter]|uniref:Efflux RND transporter periplasmic adaptor subunit n=1 Tax=Acinetobacter johnsonii TaxID=40214 RepID=A0AAJ6LGP9_ACIJO|nr:MULTISPECIES: efflux RND transporter periplasmic adaptor subunit [Acinetobacter]MDN5623347.1 efflux RND transporter periplasmic adaptor subunit [Acinetobacter sp.]OHC25438.1 MAG: efflux transporter periplasmic adaptor subunit [Pseudomonadales bacterium RIFCSPHIGHO2_12_FULL_40_16]ALV74472.1 cobalt-zinc-cadmium resistance protein [Acinetobacter johnsonii XBB1]MCF7643158.1 efflux RND transporter periplasmic adaptor subunit [Acinetobacter johnsonii]MCV2452654.1 efflux RND transporter periplasmi